MASADDDYDDGATTATTMAKATALRTTTTMTVQWDANNKDDVE